MLTWLWFLHNPDLWNEVDLSQIVLVQHSFHNNFPSLSAMWYYMNTLSVTVNYRYVSTLSILLQLYLALSQLIECTYNGTNVVKWGVKYCVYSELSRITSVVGHCKNTLKGWLAMLTFNWQCEHSELKLEICSRMKYEITVVLFRDCMKRIEILITLHRKWAQNLLVQ